MSRVHLFCNLPSRCKPTFYFIIFLLFSPTIWRCRRVCDRMLVGFTTTHSISAYPTDIESSNPAQAKCTTLCDKVCHWLAAGRLFSPGTPVSSTNEIDRHDISEILIECPIKQHKPNQPTLQITNNEAKLGFWLGFVRVMMFNATFNNISVISWRLALLVEETEVPGENQQLASSHWQTSSHNVQTDYYRVLLAMSSIRTHKC